MTKKLFCWQCGKPLNYRHGAPMFVVVTLPGGNQVKTHKVCRQGAIDYQTFEGTPLPGSFESPKRGSILRRDNERTASIE